LTGGEKNGEKNATKITTQRERREKKESAPFRILKQYATCRRYVENTKREHCIKKEEKKKKKITIEKVKDRKSTGLSESLTQPGRKPMHREQLKQKSTSVGKVLGGKKPFSQEKGRRGWKQKWKKKKITIKGGGTGLSRLCLWRGGGPWRKTTGKKRTKKNRGVIRGGGSIQQKNRREKKRNEERGGNGQKCSAILTDRKKDLGRKKNKFSKIEMKKGLKGITSKLTHGPKLGD